MERVSAQQLQEWAAEARERWSVPGLTVGLLHEGETVVAADGVCELGRDERVAPDTPFRIAWIAALSNSTRGAAAIRRRDRRLPLRDRPADRRA